MFQIILQARQNSSSKEENPRLQLTSIATNDVATSEFEQDMLSAENQGTLVSEHVTSGLLRKMFHFLIHLKTTMEDFEINVPNNSSQKTK